MLGAATIIVITILALLGLWFLLAGLFCYRLWAHLQALKPEPDPDTDPHIRQVIP